MSATKKVVVLSCEHGGNAVPDSYKTLFEGAEEVLKTHRGYDLGALDLFCAIKSNDIFHSQAATISRLLVDVNRSHHRRTLFSEFTKALSCEEKKRILSDYYDAYRQPFAKKVFDLWSQNKTVLHLSVHSFTPELNGHVRQTDFGILYHPGRIEEKQFALLWKKQLKNRLPHCRVRFNYPFCGKPDGFVRYFRDREEEKYLGIEFEMNQKYAGNQEVYKHVVSAFNAALYAWRK
ncbi:MULTISPECIES: N-formylglutamate amidohydrolase [unclassified Carboxylicivirga]|uniref:N-formylglutamate amidohydrolase n=1 Tax=Carboxylicivirga TaxID=1628153 RepID=UPI003D342F56